MKCERCLDDAVYVTFEGPFGHMFYCRKHIEHLIQNGNYDYLYKSMRGMIGQPKTIITKPQIINLNNLMIEMGWNPSVFDGPQIPKDYDGGQKFADAYLRDLDRVCSKGQPDA